MTKTFLLSLALLTASMGTAFAKSVSIWEAKEFQITQKVGKDKFEIVITQVGEGWSVTVKKNGKVEVTTKDVELGKGGDDNEGMNQFTIKDPASTITRINIMQNNTTGKFKYILAYESSAPGNAIKVK